MTGHEEQRHLLTQIMKDLSESGRRWTGHRELTLAGVRCLRDLMVRQSIESIAEPGLQGEASRGMIALDDALTRITVDRGQGALVIELIFFGGLTGEEIAEALGISFEAAGRHFSSARATLSGELKNVLGL